MKLKECIDLGLECGLYSIEECLDNIEIHCMNLFSYSEIERELGELLYEYEACEDSLINTYIKESYYAKGRNY